MRVLLVSDYYPPFLGGAQRQIQLIAKELDTRGYEVNVATLWHPGMDYHHEDNLGISVYRLRQIRTLLSRYVKKSVEQHHPPFPDPVTVMGLRQLINRLKPDIVHSYGWISYSCAMALFGKKIPLIISSRDYGYSCATRELLYKGEICDGPGLVKCFGCSRQYFGIFKGTLSYLSIYFGRSFLFNRVAALHSVSTYVRDINRRDLVGKRQSMLAVYGGRVVESVNPSFLINTPSYPDDDEILEQLPKDPYILFVGGLQPRKGMHILIEAYKRLESPPPLVLIGYVVSNTPKNFPSDVYVLQNVPHNQVMTAWKHCLFGVVPSLWADPSPGVVKEAMSQGKVIIGTIAGGITEMIEDSKTGILVPLGNISALAEAMKRLIEDKVLREEIGKAAQQEAERYRAEISILQYEALYTQVIENYST